MSQRHPTLMRDGGPYPRSLRERQIRLLILAMAAFMVIIDGTVVFVALPSIQDDLGFSQANLAWVVNAYLVTLGGFLLLGGRLGDIVGRKRIFMAGMLLFVASSLVAGLAPAQAVLIGARFFQGIGAALANAGVLALIVTLFPKPRDRVKALGLYAFVVTSGGALGLLAGGALTEGVDWRWIFFVNVPIGGVTALLAGRLLDEEKGTDKSADVPGAVLITVGTMLLVYTILQTDTHGWLTQRSLLLAVLSAALLVVFVVREGRVRNPLVPLRIFSSRNVSGAGAVVAILNAGLSGTFFLGALYLQQVLGYRVLSVGLAFVPMAVMVAAVSVKVVPRALKHFDPKTVLVAGLVLDTVGLSLLTFLPVHADYVVHLLPALLLVGVGVGLGTPSVLRMALSGATADDAGLASGVANTMQQVGGALGLAVLATIATSRTDDLLLAGQAPELALTDGFRLAFLVAVAIVGAGTLLAAFVLEVANPHTAPRHLDETRLDDSQHGDLRGVKDADFVALGLGCASMMAMLWTVAMGRRAVGVELRGGPFVGVTQWALRRDIYHHFAMIDRMMLERYGEGRVPHLGDGRIFRLAERVYSDNQEEVADTADEVVSGYDDADLFGTIHAVELMDDRGLARGSGRVLTEMEPPAPPDALDASRLDRDLRDVLADPPGFEGPATETLVLLRRYLEAIEKIDLAAGLEQPRVRILDSHRVIPPSSGRWPRRRHRTDGLQVGPDGRVAIKIERVRELDESGRKRRVRVPDSEDIDLGTPELYMIAQGPDSADAKRLGFVPNDVMVDRGDGRGPVAAQADYLLGSIGVFIDARFRRRIAAERDQQGREYWIRQVAVGRKEDAQIGWVMLEVPDFRTFDPVVAGLAPPWTPRRSARWFAGHRHLLRHYFLDQACDLLGLAKDDLLSSLVLFGPKMFRFGLRIGDDARVAGNGVVAGDTFGTGLHLESGGPNTALLGHGRRVLRYWRSRDAGVDRDRAVRDLADGIEDDTQAWIDASLPDLAQPAAPPRDDAEAAKAVAVVEATRRHREPMLETDFFDQWTRFQIHPGRLLTDDLPELDRRQAAEHELVTAGPNGGSSNGAAAATSSNGSNGSNGSSTTSSPDRTTTTASPN